MKKKVINSKKAVMIGCGFVGSASVFALMQSGLFTERLSLSMQIRTRQKEKRWISVMVFHLRVR